MYFDIKKDPIKKPLISPKKIPQKSEENPKIQKKIFVYSNHELRTPFYIFHIYLFHCIDLDGRERHFQGAGQFSES